MMQNLILHTIPLSELKSFIQEAIQSELTQLYQHSEKGESERLYTRKEVADLLGISLPTLNTYTKEGIIDAYRLGTQVRYKYEDLEKALKKINVIKYSHKRK
mgnify:CR=1 FL=1